MYSKEKLCLYADWALCWRRIFTLYTFQHQKQKKTQAHKHDGGGYDDDLNETWVYNVIKLQILRRFALFNDFVDILLFFENNLNIKIKIEEVILTKE